MTSHDPQHDDEPLDPTLERVQARLRRLMLIAGLTLGVGIFAVFGAILYRIATLDSSDAVAYQPGAPVPTMSRTEMGLPADAELAGSGATDGQVVLTYKHAAGETLIFIDAETLVMIRRLDISRGGQPGAADLPTGG